MQLILRTVISRLVLCAGLGAVAVPLFAADLTQPIAPPEVIFEERDGLLAIEGEHFFQQTLAEKRAWHITSSKAAPTIKPDADPPHLAGTSGGAYVELLPDTRRTDQDPLITGENFSDKPGVMAVLHYKIRIQNPGRYYVWIRCYSTGAEDNGVHIGLNGQWPASGQRWQTVAKNAWTWDCKQRTAEVHTGVPMALFLDIETAGDHELLVSLREDGFEMDKLVLAKSRDYQPQGLGPEIRVAAGQLPAPFPYVEPPPGSPAKDSSPAASAAAVPAGPPVQQPRLPDGKGDVTLSGELKQWHKITLTLDGPFAHERDHDPNPFTDYRLTVEFAHESGAPRYRVPGYFAADGNAAHTSAEAGTRWRAHLAPDKPGRWNYTISFLKGPQAALHDQPAGAPVPGHGRSGSFTIAPTDKTGRDFRAKGRLQYVGKHHLQFAGTGEYFLKAGADAPENLLAFADFDGTFSRKASRQARPGEATPAGLKTWQAHVRDWRPGDPTWKDGRGKGLIGALNYLAGKGCNAFSFLPYNVGGDGDDVWPFVAPTDKLHYDCSKLDQWGIVFDHATQLGLYLHFKLQETEMDDNRLGDRATPGVVPSSLDGGALGPERRLYCRELIARFGHALALNWNLGEENTQTPEEQRAMAQFLRDTDPYKHPIVIHTYPNWQDRVYPPLLGDQSALTGASLQNDWSTTHQRTLKWVQESARAGKPWVVANDEQGPADLGVPPDPGYAGFDGKARQGNKAYDLHDIRKLTLWGNLMAGGAGVEYYFGYKLPQNDLNCDDWRSRDRSWDYCRIALQFFAHHQIPFWDMQNANPLIGNPKNDNSKYCLAKPGGLYLVYLPNGTQAGPVELDLSGIAGAFQLQWFNPRTGSPMGHGTVAQINGGGKVSLGAPPADPGEDWLVVIRKN